jgi:hypothetical protein
MNIPQLLLLVLGHFFGDFVFQTEKMALNKWSQWGALLSHVRTYMVCIACAMIIAPGTTLLGSLIFAALNGLLHLVTDRISSNVMKQAREAGNQRKFFLALGADQLTHMLCFFLTSPLLF